MKPSTTRLTLPFTSLTIIAISLCGKVDTAKKVVKPKTPHEQPERSGESGAAHMSLYDAMPKNRTWPP